jgi:chitodextrinase
MRGYLTTLLAACLLLGAAVAHGATGPTSISLAWTAPGDDGLVGQAAQYDLRYSTVPITAGNFAAATRWVGTPSPSVSGAADSVMVSGLLPYTLYYFAIKAADEVPNWSAISNVASATTEPLPDVVPPAPILDLRSK